MLSVTSDSILFYTTPSLHSNQPLSPAYLFPAFLEELIRQKDITVNEAAIRSGVPPSTLKNILYGQSKNVGVVTIKKLCDGLEITIPEFFGDSIFAELEPEL